MRQWILLCIVSGCLRYSRMFKGEWNVLKYFLFNKTLWYKFGCGMKKIWAIGRMPQILLWHYGADRWHCRNIKKNESVNKQKRLLKFKEWNRSVSSSSNPSQTENKPFFCPTMWTFESRAWSLEHVAWNWKCVAVTVAPASVMRSMVGVKTQESWSE